MPTYERATPDVDRLAKEIIAAHAFHEPLREKYLTVDFIFARPDYDDDGAPKNDAIRIRGRRAYGCCRITMAKEIAAGRACAEITLDADWWTKTASEEMQAAVLDHELTHLEIVLDKQGLIVRDDADRPKLKLRKHDVEMGWFNGVAERHREHSIERIQAKEIMDIYGQLYFPSLAPVLADASVKFKVTGGGRVDRKAAADLPSRIDSHLGYKRKKA